MKTNSQKTNSTSIAHKTKKSKANKCADLEVESDHCEYTGKDSRLTSADLDLSSQVDYFQFEALSHTQEPSMKSTSILVRKSQC